MKYLYGASVQGIQQFIFQTNKLSDIIGASELVEEICTTQFAKLVYKDESIKYSQAKEKLSRDDNAIIFAAGNVKYIFDDEDLLKNIVLNFPKMITYFAPGITASQAVVSFSDDNNFSDTINELEKRIKIQRNSLMRSSNIGLIGIRRSRQTGFPALEINKDGDFLDAASIAKANSCSKSNLHKKAFGDTCSFSTILRDISKLGDKNSWIAIIHADGNGLGKVVQKIGTDIKKYKEFSKKLDIATIQASQETFYEVQKYINNTTIPIRPIVIGGDDITIICRGDIALDYTKIFLKKFEEKTQKYLGDILKSSEIFSMGEARDYLTACAGIAYIKESYPFYYGYSLAEELCSESKKDAKNKETITEGKELPQSALMFHKVQDSFFINYSDIKARELQPQDNISFSFGPYYLQDKDNRWTIEKLQQTAQKLEGDDGNKVKSGIRNWISLLHNNPEVAKQKLERIKSLSNSTDSVISITSFHKRGEIDVCPAYDILTINTINNQQTK